MHIDNIEDVVALYLSEAREILPRVEASFSELITDGQKKIVQIGVQLPSGMAITYSAAKDLDELAEKITKRDGIPIAITTGGAPTISKKEIPKVPLQAPSINAKTTTSKGSNTNEPKTNKAQTWKLLIDATQEHIKCYELEQAEILILKALELAETLPTDDRRQGINLEILTEIYFRMNKYELCAPFMVRLLEMYKRCLGKDHVDTGTITHNLAVLYHNWERIEEAVFHYKNAISIKSKALGENHQDVQLIKSQFEQLQETVKKPSSVSQILKKSKPSRRNKRNSLARTQQLKELGDIPEDEKLTTL